MFSYQQIKINKESAESLHIQLTRELRRLIRELDPGTYDTLPSERQLCTNLGINRNTVHCAYNELLNQGLVTRQANKSLLLNSQVRKRLEGTVPTIGVILPKRFSDYVQSPNSSLYLQGIIDRAMELNYAVQMLQLPRERLSEAERKTYIETRFSGLTGLLHLGARGILHDELLSDIFHYTGVPQVCISGWVDLPHIGSVCCNVDSGVKKMVKEFQRIGIRRVGMVDFPQNKEDAIFSYSSNTRIQRIAEKLTCYGIEVPREWILHTNKNIKKDTAFWENALRSQFLPDAFCCCNDQTARHLMKLAESLGISVPRQLKIIGFNGFEKDGILASICHPCREIGKKAVDFLLERFEKGTTPENRFCNVNTDFINGQTLSMI